MIILHDLQRADGGSSIAPNSYDRFIIVLKNKKYICITLFAIYVNQLNNLSLLCVSGVIKYDSWIPYLSRLIC